MGVGIIVWKTSNNQRLVRSKERPKNFLKCSIHVPGLGSTLSIAGKIPTKRNGKLSPSPTDKNIRRVTGNEEVKAKVSATPKNGALQGVDKIVARTPEMKSLLYELSMSIFPITFPPGVLIS